MTRKGSANLGLATGRQKLLGHLAALLFAILIGGSFSVGHLAAPYLSSAALNAVRFLVGFIVMLAVNIALLRGLPSFPVKPWRYLILGGLMATYFLTMFVALKITAPVATGAVFTLIPLMSAGFGFVILRQTTRPFVLLSLLVAAIGAIWVIFRGSVEDILAFRIGQGELIFLVGCACHALVAPLVRKFDQGESGSYYTFWLVTSTMVWIVLIAGKDLVETDWGAMPSIVWLAIIYLAIATTAITFYLVMFASMRLPASKVLSYGYLTPSVVILLEGLLGHGWVSVSIFAGAVITAIALMIMAFAPDQ